MYTNARLYDVLTRHQIYVEGVKTFHARQFNEVLRELQTELNRLFFGVQSSTLDGLTKAALRSLIIELKKAQSRVYNAYSEKLIKQLKTFMQADVKVTKIIYSTMGKPEGEDEEPVDEEEADEDLEAAYEENEGENLYPLAFFSNAHNGGDYSKLWGAVTNAPIPANGILLLPFINGFINSASSSVENIVRKGYANRSNVQDVLNEIVGTGQRNYRDGAFSRINSQAGAVTATVIQHISSIAQAGIASAFFGRYRWASVIDSGTTEICRSRNNKIYKYGEGPLPPAHIKCRSKTIPVAENDDSEPTTDYYSWLKSQPNVIQDDIIGTQKAGALRSGKTKQKDLSQFEGIGPLSVEDFVSKLGNILTR